MDRQQGMPGWFYSNQRTQKLTIEAKDFGDDNLPVDFRLYLFYGMLPIN